MADYNLYGLSTRSFEQLIQALAAKVIGPNIIIFGDEPDGAREATFEGSIPYPSDTNRWSGYGVLQAKFLQKSKNPQYDGDWTVAQLRAELKKFSERPLRRPEYYIFATNVTLTAANNAGYKDRIESLLESCRSTLNLKGYDIWDYDKIRVLLDNNRDVAISYAAGIVTGDILSKLFGMLEGFDPDFESTIANFLQKEMLADQYAYLEQAGHNPDDKVPLANVFIDLPVADERLYEPPTEHSSGFIAELVSAGSAKFDQDSSTSKRGNLGRYVLVGGPGQGKSTVGQYLCQLFRASLLNSRKNIAWEAKNALQTFTSNLTQESLVRGPFI